MKKQQGFTLVELVVVIIIVGILSVVAVPIYRSYTQRAMMAEGVSFVRATDNAETSYYTKNGVYLSVSTATNYSKALMLDAKRNKYFSTFQISARNNFGSNNSQCTWNLTSFGSGKAAGITVKARGSNYWQTSISAEINGEYIDVE